MEARSGFIFYRSFWNAAKRLSDEDQFALLKAIISYGLDTAEPTGSGIVPAMFELVRPQIDANNKRRENGSRPKEKSNATEQSEAKQSEANGSEAKQSEANGSETKQSEAKEKGKEKEKGERESKNENDNSVSPEPEKSGSPGKPKAEKIFFDYSGDARIHGITTWQLEYWKDSFPAIDVETEIKSAETWLDTNRKNRKSDLKRFLVAWFKRAQDCAPRVPGQTAPKTDENGQKRWEI